MRFRVPSQPRTLGPEWSRHLYFGADSASASTPAAYRDLLAQLTEHASQCIEGARLDLREVSDRDVLDIIESPLESATIRLRAVHDRLSNRDVERPFRVVLMGRTMAGKSTLFEFLTGGDGERIGVGGQRTTRDASTRTLSDLSDVEIVDTPGVGAMDGESDFDMAFAEVEDADLILWVATNQATQEATGRALRRLADLGKPILVALNCLADVRDEINYYDLLEEPDVIFGGDAEANLAPIRRHLSAAGSQFLEAFLIHAQAAQISQSGRHPTEESEHLLRSSRVVSLLNAIRRQRDQTASVRRLVSLADSVKYELLESAQEVEAVSDELRALFTAIHGSSEIFKNRARRRVEDAHKEVKAALFDAISARERWIEQVDIDTTEKLINEAWNLEVEALQRQLDTSTAEIVRRLKTDLKLIAIDVAEDWSEVETGGFRNLGGIGAIWGNRTVKVAGRVATSIGGGWAGAKLGAFIGTAIAGPPGTAIGGTIGTIAGAILASLISTPGFDWVADRIFGSTETLHQRRRERIHNQLTPILRDLAEKGETASKRLLGSWHDAIDEALSLRGKLGESVEIVLARLIALSAEELEPILIKIDTELARAVLRHKGRDRAADALIQATRWRGAGMAVNLPTAAFAEMVLFPMSEEVERMAPTRYEATPSMNALQIIRSLTDKVVSVHMMRENELIVSFASPMASGAREAWESLARVHTGTTVRIVEPIEGDSDD